MNNLGLTPKNKGLRIKLLEEIFRINQLIYNGGISQNNNLITIYELAESISEYHFRNKLQRNIVRRNYSNFPSKNTK